MRKLIMIPDVDTVLTEEFESINILPVDGIKDVAAS